MKDLEVSHIHQSDGDTFSTHQRRFLSVVIPAYNVAKSISMQLDALKNQEYKGKWEIIVVDNGSTDGTVEVVQSYLPHLRNLRLVGATAKHGVAYARNFGAGVARGDALLFCDGDDVVAPGWLAAFASALEKYDFVAGKLEVGSINRDNIWCPSPSNWAVAPVLNFLPFAGGALMAVSRWAFEKIKGFREDIRVAEDIDFSWRLQLNGIPLHYVSEAIINVRFRSTWQALWLQTVAFAEGHVWLFKEFASQGMPRSSIRDIRLAYKQLLSNLIRWAKLQPKERTAFVRMAATRWGRLKGSIRYCVLYL